LWSAGFGRLRVARHLVNKLIDGLSDGAADGLAEGAADGLAEGDADGEAEGAADGLADGEAEGLAEGLEDGDGVVEHMPIWVSKHFPPEEQKQPSASVLFSDPQHWAVAVQSPSR